MARFKYNPGDIKNDCKLISRNYRDINGDWYGHFQCLKCEEIFEQKIKRVFCENKKRCKCNHFKSDMIGKTKGVLTIFAEAPSRQDDRNAYWMCRCECGKEFEISTTDFNRREHKYCVHNGPVSGRPISQDLTNQTFGKLKVIRYLKDSTWECECECGNIVNKKTNVLQESRGLGCPICLRSISSGELLLEQIFDELKLDYVYQQSFETCRFPQTNKLAKFDFYLPQLNVLIEYNGAQHYKKNPVWYPTDEDFQAMQERDKYKIQWCKENNIPLIIIPYTEKINTDYIKELLKDYI